MSRKMIARAIAAIAAGTAILALGACSSSEEVQAPPTPTTAPVQQPGPAATAAPGAPAAPAATAIPGATAMPQPTAAPAGEPKYGGIMVVSNRGDPPSWDPMRSTTITVTNMSGTMYGNGNLVKTCRENLSNICPGMAESWEANSDFTEWTFKIRENVVWHDGTPFTPEDVTWWIDLWVNGVEGRTPGRRSLDFGSVKSLDVLDGNRVRITLNEPLIIYPTLLSNNTTTFAHARHLFQPEIDRGNPDVSPDEVGWVGTGPFTMLRYRRGSVVSVRRFDDYWEKDEQGRQLPFLNGMDFPIVGDSSTMMAALRTDRLDGTARGDGFYLNAEQIAILKSEMGDKIWFGEIGGNAKQLVPNTLRSGPWQDVRVRKALSLWFDHDAGIQAVRGGLGVIRGWYEPTSKWASDYSSWPGYSTATKEADRAEAKRLLADAGYAEGFDTMLVCREFWVLWCVFTAAQLSDLGIRTDLDLVDTATRDARNLAADFDLIIAGGPAFLYPEVLRPLLVTHELNAASNLKHNDQKVNELFEGLFATNSDEERVRIGKEIDTYTLLDQAYALIFWTDLNVIAYRDYVKGVIVAEAVPQANTTYARAWLDK